MSGKWEGFTDEDIKLMSGKETPTTGKHHQKRNVKPKSVEGSRKSSYKSSLEGGKSANIEGIPNEARLSKPKASPVADENVITVLKERNNEEGNFETNEEVRSPKSETLEESPSINTVCLKIKNNVAYEVLGNEVKSSSDPLSDFHFRQKMMEEQNRKRKELLAQALAERKKKTHAEAHRLQAIQEELQKLDNLLSNDVSILRNQIEAACLDFTEAQKRYDKAEKEFLEAKLILFSKMEKKELLTGHLCTIIEQNELRKARKLSELMEKLHISSLNPEIDAYQGTTGPTLISSSEKVVYSGATTIKDPRSKSKVIESHPAESTNGKDGVQDSKNEIESPETLQNALHPD